MKKVESPSSNKPIFIVDDEHSICDVLKGILEDEGYATESFGDADGLFQRMKATLPGLVLLDIWLPGIDGMGVLSKIKERHPALPVIMMSGHAGIEAAVSSIKMGAYDFLEKPLHLEVLLDKVAGALSLKPKREKRTISSDTRMEMAPYTGPIGAATWIDTQVPQRTLKKDVVLNGFGLLSGRPTGLILSPLDENQGIIFQSLDGTSIPAHVTSLENVSEERVNQTFTANSTVLVNQNYRVRTVEHL